MIHIVMKSKEPIQQSSLLSINQTRMQNSYTARTIQTLNKSAAKHAQQAAPFHNHPVQTSPPPAPVRTPDMRQQRRQHLPDRHDLRQRRRQHQSVASCRRFKNLSKKGRRFRLEQLKLLILMDGLKPVLAGMHLISGVMPMYPLFYWGRMGK